MNEIPEKINEALLKAVSEISTELILDEQASCLVQNSIVDAFGILFIEQGLVKGVKRDDSIPSNG
jgi:hypothetical protein